MSNGNGHRWSKFWWDDHASEPTLKLCSLAARGLWSEMLPIMFSSTQTGFLLIGNRTPTMAQLATIVGASEDEVRTLLAELWAAGVYSRSKGGVIYCRRMVRDAAASEVGRRTGRRGGNPALARRPDPDNGDNWDNGDKGVKGRPNSQNKENLSSQVEYKGPYIQKTAEVCGKMETDPLTPLTGGVNPEAEAESEAEAEERKSQAKINSSLPSETPNPRERREAPLPREGEAFDDYLLRLAEEQPAERAAVQNAAGKVVRMLDGRRGQRTLDAAFKRPKAEPAAMAAEVLRGDVVPDLVPDGWEQPPPREAVRTVEQMIAALGVTPEQVARCQQLTAERFGQQPAPMPVLMQAAD